MRKIFILFIALILNCNVVFASDKTSKQSDSCIKIDVVGSTLKIKFIDFTWWKTATEEDFQADIAKGADVNARCNDGTTVLMNVIGMSDVFNETYTEMVADFPIISKEKFLELAKLLIDAGADVNAKDNEGNTALSIAIKNNNSEIIKMLINAGASDVNKVEKHKTTPSLEYMSDAKQEPLNKTTSNDKNVNENFLDYDWWETATLEDVQAEIANGADVNAKNDNFDGWTALMYALCDNKDIEIIKALLDAGADVKIIDNNETTTLMHGARYHDNPEVIKMLMENGVDIDAKNDVDWTALMYAVTHNRNREIIKLLIDAGADVRVTDSKGRTLLMLANYQNPEIIKVLAESGVDILAKDDDDRTALHHAADVFNQNPELIKSLIELGIKVNAKDNDGLTALMVAANNRNSEVVQELINAGADVNAKSFIGKTALMFAANWGDSKITKALMNAGADVNTKDMNGLTALMVAAINNKSPEVVQELINAGADVNAKDNEGNTALSIAKQQNASPEIIKLLTGKNTNFHDVNWWKTATVEDVKTEIANGADVNLEVEDDETHIMPILGMAIAKFIINPNDSNNDENYKIIELLIDAGADVNAKMKTVHVILKEEIPLLIFAFAAENYKSIKVMEKLIDAGADINMQGGHILVKQSPLMSTSEIEKTKFLIESGADVNAYSEGLWGITALMLAIRNQKAEIIKVLIDAGADVNAKCIARNINEDELIKNLYIPSKLVELDKQKYLEEAKKFVEEFKKVSPNREFIGATPLIIAAENSNPEIIRMLIDAGADTSLKSADNKTALDIAKEKNGNPEVIEILEHHQEFDEMFAECYSTQNIGKYANKFCKCAIKSAINALGPADKEKAKDAFDDARAGTFKNLIQKGKSAAFNECY